MKRSVLTSVASAREAERRLARYRQMTIMSSSELERTLGRSAAEAADWIRSAAAHDVAEAQVKLAALLFDGLGVAEDKPAALRWFLRAARAGHADAMNMAGRCYENGWGAAVDEPKAALWYRRAADSGHDWGRYNYAHMLFDGRGGVPLDRAAAFSLYHLAALQEHARAMNLVGRCLESGWGTAPDSQKAAVWYQRSAEAGYYRAQFNHALVLIQRGDTKAAEPWLARAVEGGDDAMRGHVSFIRKALEPVTLDGEASRRISIVLYAKLTRAGASEH